MQARNDISEELRSLSVLVDGIGRQAPYVVPEGYFDNLAQLVLARVSANSLVYSVPEGYFEGFASSVLDRIKAGQGMVGPTAGSALGADLESSDRKESVQGELLRLSAVLSGISRETPYRLPEGYFEELSPVLTLLREKSTYQVPAGYFEAMAVRMAAKVVGAVPASPRVVAASVVEIGSRRGRVLKGNWWKYAAAAMVAGLILTLSWPQLHNAGSVNTDMRPAPMDLSKVLNKVSDQEIENYMDDEQGSILAEPVASSTANLDINDNDVKTLLGDVPDGELKQYLDEHGRANDIATN